MSVANFDGDGYGDTSGLVYGYETDETDDKEIRNVVRSGYGHLGVSPGDVQPMSSTRSTLDDRLPKQSLPGDVGYKQDDFGDNIPAQNQQLTALQCAKHFSPLSTHNYPMTDENSPIEITFSKKVDTDGRMVVPQEHRQALTIDGREALVEFTAKKVTYLDEDDGGESA